MNYLFLIISIMVATEIIFKTNYFDLVIALIKTTKRSIYIIMHNHISDHWKEKIIPSYSQRMMKISTKMLLIFLSIILIFPLVDLLLEGFIEFLLTFKGILASFLFAIAYVYLRKLFFNG